MGLWLSTTCFKNSLTNIQKMFYLPGFIAVALILGYLLINIKQLIIFRLLGWTYALLSVSAIIFLTDGLHPILRMLEIIIVLLLAMKIIVTGEIQVKSKEKLSFTRWILFSLGWVGMRPEVFQRRGTQGKEEAKDYILFGVSSFVTGLMIIMIIRFAEPYINFSIPFTFYSTALLILLAFSLILHFGLLSISTGFWRIIGFPTKQLFKSPASSLSLEEFWGKRWNVAFSEMTAIVIFKPIASASSKNVGLLAAFVFSGILHELAISVPVDRGYGLPTLYFIIQGIAILIESHLNKISAFLKQTLVAKLWTVFWLVAPLLILFHNEFLRKVIFPIAGLNIK
jgi:hypothetical protein